MNLLERLSTKKTLDVLGLMSGTSLDGLDLALCRVSESGRRFRVKVLATGFHSFPPELHDWIYQAASNSKIEKSNIKKLDLTLAVFYLSAVDKFIKKNKLTKIDLIASHGQTIYHRDGRGKNNQPDYSSSWQLGEGAYLSTLAKIPVVSDFRMDDIAAGGAGAPLTPLCHYHLFGQTKKTCAVLNIGGITNLTLLPKTGRHKDISASDCGPGNMLVDQLMQKCFDKKYDSNGRIALKGSVNQLLLGYLMKFSWYKKTFPKSLGREQFGILSVDKIIKFAKKHRISNENIITTVSELTVRAVLKYIEKTNPLSELLVCGGGVHNKYFMRRLEETLPGTKVQSTSGHGFDPDYVESVCFALLGFMYLRAVPAALTAVTGAKSETVLGKLSLP